ncbi:cell surface glycoprotein CD200 receptor 1-A isoform X2 [Pimephales promelas]|uniref:cell surface glycoprotein CD200 receptor 1-A isoform X2 n=1 Tax=Pimephales promelas TaxID=90988 RepID=UPI00195571BD|nr:cell surface glycoprotein CD200 receptor 1-A isoform X2 [Pimephales promelas]
MANSKTLTVVVLLSIFLTRSHTRDFKEQIFVEGSDVSLWCANNVTDVKLNELIFIVWNISMQGKKCYLGSETKLDNTCNDGKRLYNTSNGVSLFIPKISMEDEGFYYCDLSIKGGSKSVNVSVSVIRLKTRLDIEHGQRIAVCEATYKKTKPTLHWEPAMNFSFIHKQMDNFLIIESRVHLPDNVTISNLTCVASYPSVSGSLRQKSTLDITTRGKETRISTWEIIGISLGSVFLILASLAAAYLLCRKRKHISSLKMLCCKSKISPPAEDKPPQPTNVEEVEPYASYIQRVNSIYNSSAELCNA